MRSIHIDVKTKHRPFTIYIYVRKLPPPPPQNFEQYLSLTLCICILGETNNARPNDCGYEGKLQSG